MFRTLIIASLVALLLQVASAQQVSPRAIPVPVTPGRITIDGTLSEQAWKGAGRTGAFTAYRRNGEPANQTQALFIFDDKALYIGFRCAEKDMAHIKSAVKEHDGGVWNDDAIEIFLDVKGDRTGFVQFILNTIGTKYDGLGNDHYGFNPKWEGKAALGKMGWTAEVRLPFGELGVSAPKPGDAWLGNICRDEQPSAELSSWCATSGSFTSTASFGEIIFGTYAQKAVKDLAGQSAAIKATEQRASGLRVDLSGIMGQAKTKLAAAKSMLSASRSVDESAYHRVQSVLNGNKRLLTDAADVLRRAEMGNPDYIVWQTTPWRHFAMREDYSSVRTETKAISAVVLAGQTESRALMVTNLTREMLSARVALGGFPKDSVEMLIPAFVRCANGAAYPDALVPPDRIGQISIPSGETRQIWLNLKGITPGAFKGTVTISPLTASKVDKQVELSVDVVRAPGELPVVPTFTWDFLGEAEERGLVDKYMQTMADHLISVYCISGLWHMPRPKADDAGNLLEPMDWSKFEEQVRLKWKPGRKLYINMDVWEKAAERPIYNGKFDTPGWRIACKKVVGEMAQVLKRLGLSYDDYMVNPLDESIDQRYIAIARLIREADPQIRIVEDTIGENLAQVKEADKYVDHWIPHFKAYRSEGSRESIAYLKSNGKPLGFYFYSEGADEKAQDSYSHFTYDFWFAYSQNLDGVFGYWTATQHYGNPWNRHQSDALYDPSLFYPGDGCVITGRRWEAWRRGTEDFALLKLCESGGVDKRIIEQAVKSVVDAPRDRDAAERARERLVRALAAK